MAFPTVWQLLLPNFNITTVIGIILIIVAILGFVFSSFFSFIGGIKLVKKISALIFLLGIVLIWGISMFQDFISSPEGQLIFWGTILVIVFAVLLFWDNIFPKNTGGGILK